MQIAYTTPDVGRQILSVLKRHGITHAIRWQGGSPIDEKIRMSVNGFIDLGEEAMIRRDIEAIPGAAVQE